MKYRVEPELLEEARKAVDWYETKGGMKVASPPGIPHHVASWILRHCEADR